MPNDLRAMSRKELQKLKADVEKALKAAKARDWRAAKKAAEQAAAEFGFTLGDITSEAQPAKPAKRKYKKRAPEKNKGVAKYRNPQNPDQTWTGKGRQPAWFKAAMEKGTNPEKLEI